MKPLSPFGIVYGRIMDARNAMYDREWLRSYPLGARTISVGNLTTGGTGKTPLVALIAEILIGNGEKVCILTRGYGRDNPRSRVLVADGENVLTDAATGGDEPVELAHRLGGKTVIVADANRVAAAEWALKEFGVTAFVLDDGFQHRRAKRDLDIVCVDATNPCGNGRLLPAGTLRESFRGLARADAIVITRTEQVGDVSAIESRLRRRNQTAPIFNARTELKGLVPIEKFPASTKGTQADNDGPIFALTGIANPENFFATLTKSGLKIAGSESFSDHHRFTQSEIDALSKRLQSSGAKAVVTTGKDAVKLKQLELSFPCYVAVVEIAIDPPEEFASLIISS